MNRWTQLHMFVSANARLQLRKGFAELIKASELGPAHVGRGIYHQKWRDHEWLYISDVRHSTGGRQVVSIEYLDLDESTRREEQLNCVSVVSEERVSRHYIEFFPEDEILLSKEPVERPVGRRVTCVTTRTEQVLGD